MATATVKRLMTLLSNQGLDKQRGTIVSELTNGRTTSVRALTTNEMDYLCKYYEERERLQQNALDKKRKRVIAAIFGLHAKMNKTVSMEYVKGIACRIAKAQDFNKISESRLDSLYNAFRHSQKDLEASTRIVQGYISEQQYYN